MPFKAIVSVLFQWLLWYVHHLVTYCFVQVFMVDSYLKCKHTQTHWHTRTSTSRYNRFFVVVVFCFVLFCFVFVFCFVLFCLIFGFFLFCFVLFCFFSHSAIGQFVLRLRFEYELSLTPILFGGNVYWQTRSIITKQALDLRIFVEFTKPLI